MDAFGDLDDAMQDALDATYGERVRILPQAAAAWRGQGGADPGREVREIVGRYRAKPVTGELEGNREGSKFQSMTRISGTAQTMRVSPGELAKLGYALQPNDKVQLIDRPGAPIFTIMTAGLRDSGEAALEMASGG